MEKKHKLTLILSPNITKSLVRKFFVIVSFILVFFVVFLPSAKAADMSFSPSSGKYSSQVFPVAIYIASPNQSVNAVSGTINFPKDKLNLVSISKAGSVVSIWVQEPTFSNTTGTANFEGIILNPGFTGGSGNIITLNFKGISSGTAAVKFNSGSVLANDGKGTNVLKDFGNATFSIVNDSAPVASQKTSKIPPVVEKVVENISDQASNVSEKPTLLNIGSLVMTIFVVVICTILIITLCGFLIIYGWHKFSKLINGIRKDIQRLKEANSMEKRELALIRQNIKNSSVAAGKDLEQLRKANTMEEEELAGLRSKLENKTVLLEKDIQQLKEVNALKLEDFTKSGLNLKAQLENKTILLERDIQQLKENNIIREQELASIKNNIKNLGEDYKNISAGETELRAKITRIINSLEAFDANTILMDDTVSGAGKITKENKSIDLPNKYEQDEIR